MLTISIATPTTTTTSTPHATTSHANHPLLSTPPASQPQPTKKDKVQAIILGSLLGCALGAIVGWVGMGVWRSSRSRRGVSRRKGCGGGSSVKAIRCADVQARKFPAKDTDGLFEDKEEVDAFIGQNCPFPCPIAFVSDETQPQAPNDDRDRGRGDKETLTRSWLARTFTAHRREGTSRTSTKIISTNGGMKFLEAPSLLREPTRTTLSFNPSSHTTSMPAPTIFSSTAFSHDYQFDGDEEVYDSAHVSLLAKTTAMVREEGRGDCSRD
ncbi:hypothetical protein BD410DRAFT_315116 [Rickenella mellea]|uniref:Uncharacterized protein n=1 Tax=Rickenella mellea TaxID=50990 RepID=A0A4Y7Q1Q7_9AGAM|nr:hypothetical protein BD410DRAFT_315116 [Rickenella mellea]